MKPQMNRRQRRRLARLKRQGKCLADVAMVAVPKQGPTHADGLPSGIHGAKGIRFPAGLLGLNERGDWA